MENAKFWETESATLKQKIGMRLRMIWTAMTAQTVVVISIEADSKTKVEEAVVYRVGRLEDLTDAVLTIGLDMEEQLSTKEEAQKILEQASLGEHGEDDN